MTGDTEWQRSLGSSWSGNAARKRLFGRPKLPYLMYPNGETGGERLDQLEPDAFRYALTARALAA